MPRTTPSPTAPSGFLSLLREEAGFSLTELLVVLVIIGILALLAIPRFLGLTTRAKAAEAKANLSHLYTLQQTYYFEHDRYAETLEQLGYDPNPLVTETTPSGGRGAAYYRISIPSADENTFTARAEAVVDFDKDGQFNTWEIDHHRTLLEVTPD